MKMLIKSHFNYGLVTLNFMSKINKNYWINAYKRQAKKFCGIGRIFNNELLEIILNVKDFEEKI